MKRFLLFSLLMSSVTCFGQLQTTMLELTDANVWINTNGALFVNSETGWGGYEAPANSGNIAIYSSALWISGKDADYNLPPAYRYHTAMIALAHRYDLFVFWLFLKK